MATPRTVGRLPFQRIRPALPQLMLRLLGVAHLADRGAAAQVDVADLAGRHTQLGVGAVLGDELHLRHRRSGRSWRRHRACSSMAWTTVPVGMLRSGRLLPGLMSAPGPFSIGVALLQPVRREDVALLAVGVVQQRDAGGAVGVVLDVSDLGRHAVLVVATEVDDAVGALVATTDVAGGDAAGVVAAAALGQRTDQRLLRRGARDLDEVGDARATTARASSACTYGYPCLSVLLASGQAPARRRCRSSPRGG